MYSRSFSPIRVTPHTLAPNVPACTRNRSERRRNISAETSNNTEIAIIELAQIVERRPSDHDALDRTDLYPGWPGALDGHAIHARVGGVLHHAHPVAQDRAPAEGARGIDGRDADRFWAENRVVEWARETA